MLLLLLSVFPQQQIERRHGYAVVNHKLQRRKQETCLINGKRRQEQYFSDLRLGKELDQQMARSLEGFVTSDKNNGPLSPSGFLPEENKWNKSLSPAHSLTFISFDMLCFTVRSQVSTLV